METGNQSSISLGKMWNEIPTVAKLIAFGLTLISGFVVSDFLRLVAQGPLVPGEDLYIHIALLFLVPGSTLMLFILAFGYAYYQLCKQTGKKPFWNS